ncbi:MAG: hypothetical protein L6R42_009660 [Xanthoria sp. 1 TBL-2021]|nr:MAG: hypothetical protein L6R42_009660 [Xanthoria sp. 1 TBL-2021]
MDSSMILGLLGSYLILYPIILTVYRLAFHPLSGFPGPKLAAATRLYEAYYDVLKGGKYIFKINELHKTYGKHFAGPSGATLHFLEVNLTVAAEISFLLQGQSHTGRWNKYDFSYRAFQLSRSAFGSIDHYDHKRRRAPLEPLFSRQRVAEREPFLREQVGLLVSRIERSIASASGNVLEIGIAYAAMGLDVASGYAIGKSMGNLDLIDFNKDLFRFFTDFGPLWIIGKHIPLLPWLFRRLPARVLPYLGARLTAYKNLSERNLTILRRVMAARSEDGAATSDASRKEHSTIFHELLQAADDRSPTPDGEQDLVEQCDGVIAGGSEVARVLRVLTYHLCANPAILTRLRDELDKTTPKSLQELEKLVFLTAVLTEGIRLSYGAVTRLQRIAPDRAIRYADWLIPPGTPVGMSNGLLFHDETLFPDSHSFVPDRWLNLSPPERQRMDEVFAPFGRGPRMCLGVQ